MTGATGGEGRSLPAGGTAAGTTLRWVVPALLLVGLVLAARLADDGSGPGRAISFSIVLGGLFGIVLQRARFCFLCIFRDWIDRRDARGLVGIAVALAVGTAGYAAVLGAWLPDPGAGRLPPDAHVGPVSWALALAGLVFGLGMALSGSCISAHLYRLGEGSVASVVALLGVVAGFALGFLTWNGLYVATIAEAPIPWLPYWLGYGGWVLATLGGLALLVFLATRRTGLAAALAAAPGRWPAWVGGAAVGAIGTVAYLRTAPLGVTAEIGARARQAASFLHLLPATLHGLDGFAGCATAIRRTLMTPNGSFVLAMILAAAAAAVFAGQFRPAWPAPGRAARSLAGGVLLGWGAMTAIGCTVGNLLSGIMAGAVSGWVFAIACYAGVRLGLGIGRRISP